MSGPVSTISLGVFLFIGVVADTMRGGDQHSNGVVGSLQMRLIQVSRDPLPLQACRFRLLLKNEGARPVDGLNAALPLYLSVQGPEDPEFLPVHDGILSLTQEAFGTGSGVLFRDRTFRLDRGEEISLMFSLAVDWRADGFDRDKRRAVFPAPGKYTVQVLYPIQYPVKHPIRYDSSRFLRARATVEVRAARGDENLAYTTLRENHDVVYAMLSIVGQPHARVEGDLMEILEKFPESTYADYARFALARKMLHGTGYVSLTNHEPFERFVHGFSALLTAKTESDQSLQELLAEELNGEGTEVIGKLVERRWAPSEELTKWLRAYYDLLHVSDEQRRRASALLRAIGPEADFAYHPNVLCSLKFALEGIDPMSLALIDREMKERYYDAKEWVTIQNGLIPAKNCDEWRMFRIRKSDSTAE